MGSCGVIAGRVTDLRLQHLSVYVGRGSFDNHAEYLALHGAERIIAEMPRPRISARRQLPAALAARFGIAGFGDDVEAEADALTARLAVA